MGLFSFLKRKKPATDAEPAERLDADEIAVSPQPLSSENGFDMNGFWHDNPESIKRHICPPPTDELIHEIEDELGYRLPDSYVGLMLRHNGGLVNRCRFKVAHPVEGCPDTVYITDILGIGREPPYSLCGRFGSAFLIDSRRHNKNIGIAICNTTLPGRALVFLDYRKCGPNGEPCVTYADALDGTELVLARNFTSFILGLQVNDAHREV